MSSATNINHMDHHFGVFLNDVPVFYFLLLLCKTAIYYRVVKGVGIAGEEDKVGFLRGQIFS